MQEIIVRSKDQIGDVLSMLRQSLVWTYDVETTGTNIRKDKIIGFGCVRPDTLAGFYIITHEFVNGQLAELLTKDDVRPVIVALQSKRLLMWNAGFDCGVTLYDYGISLDDALWSDVMLEIHTLNENLPNYGLKVIGAMEFGGQVADEQAEMKASIKANGGDGTGAHIYMANSALVAKYGLQDNRLTARIWNRYEPRLRAEGLYDFFYKDEVMPLLKNVTFSMERGGIPLDLPLIEQTRVEIEAEIEQLESKIHTAIAPLLDGFNDWYIKKHYPFKMSGEFRQALARRFAPEGWPRTKTGTYSFSKADIERAVKKGLIPAGTQLQAWAQEESASERVPQDVIRSVQLELMAADGIKRPFLLSSTDHLKRLFFGSSTTKSVLNETPLSRTDKGSPQIDDDFLEAMAKKYAWAEDLRTLRSLWKIHGTYVLQYLNNHEDGIFYPRWMQHRTISGRYSGDAQQLPRPMEDGQAPEAVVRFTNRIRMFFIAGPGHKLIGADYESLEPKLFSHVSGDPGLINIFIRGDDFYSTIAIDTEGLTDYSANKKADNYLGKLNKKKRQDAKEYSLGTVYGKSAYALHFSLNCSLEEAEAKHRKYLAAYPLMSAWMKSSEDKAIKQGFIRTELGRVRRYPELPKLINKYGRCLLDPLELYSEYGDSPQIYEAMKSISGKARNWVNNAKNVQIQGLAASVVNRSGIALAAVFKSNPHWEAYMCMAVHDEWVVRCRAEHADDVAKAVQHCLENTVKLKLPLLAEPCIADVYGDTK